MVAHRGWNIPILAVGKTLGPLMMVVISVKTLSFQHGKHVSAVIDKLVNWESAAENLAMRR
jgi:hypothetical protein